MKAVGCSEASVIYTIPHDTTHTQEDSIFHSHYREDLKAHILKLFHINRRCIGTIRVLDYLSLTGVEVKLQAFVTLSLDEGEGSGS